MSLQSFGETNIQHMGVGTDKQEKIIKRLLQQGKLCGVNSVLLDQSMADIKNTIDFCVQNGVRRYSIGLFMKKNQNIECGNSLQYARKI